jgi:hypothetical protein
MATLLNLPPGRERYRADDHCRNQVFNMQNAANDFVTGVRWRVRRSQQDH